jgi:hypothetical protein
MADQRMIGDILYERRRSLNLSIDRVVEGTRLQRRVIEAFEASDFDAAPPRGYATSMLGTYLRYLGLEPQEYLHLYEEQAREHERAARGPRRTEEGRPSARRPRSYVPNESYVPYDAHRTASDEGRPRSNSYLDDGAGYADGRADGRGRTAGAGRSRYGAADRTPERRETRAGRGGRDGYADRDRDDDRGRERNYGRERDRDRDRERGRGGRPYGSYDDARDRDYGRDQDRDYGRDNDRDYGRDRNRDNDRNRDRDRGYGRDRDGDRGYGRDRDRDRDYGRDRDNGRTRDYGRDRDRNDGRDGNRRTRPPRPVDNLYGGEAADGYEGGSGTRGFDPVPRSPRHITLSELAWNAREALSANPRYVAGIAAAVLLLVVVVVVVNVASCASSDRSATVDVTNDASQVVSTADGQAEQDGQAQQATVQDAVQDASQDAAQASADAEAAALLSYVDLTSIPVGSSVVLTVDTTAAAGPWVLVTLDGTDVYAQVAPPGTVLEYQPASSVSLELSTVDGVTVTVNGTVVNPTSSLGTYRVDATVAGAQQAADQPADDGDQSA